MVVALFDDEKVEIVEAEVETEVVVNVAVFSVAAILLMMVDVFELAIGVAVLIVAEVVIAPTEDCTCEIVAFEGSGDCIGVFCTTAGCCAAGDAIFC